METITLTFGDCAENHRGMQEIGEKAKCGLDLDDLTAIQTFFTEEGCECELADLSKIEGAPACSQPAHLLVIRKGVSALVSKEELLAEQMALERDKKAFMYGRVVDKKARHNLCFSDFDQEPDYENKKGRVVSFARLPVLSSVREALDAFLCLKNIPSLQCEANYYYDIKKTYIGFHGDTERRIVIAVRLGASFPIHFQWFQQSKPIGELFTRVLNDGDMYFMSEKAVGYDWKLKKEPTLRHAAGDVKKVVTW